MNKKEYSVIVAAIFLSLCTLLPFFTIAQGDLFVFQNGPIPILDLKDITTLKTQERGNLMPYLPNEDPPDTRKTIAYILSFSGGAIIGWQLGQELADKVKVDWFPTGVGLGLIAAAIPVYKGEKLSLSIRTVYGDYKMEGMKKRLMQTLFNEINEEIDMPYTVTDNFPAYIGYEISFSGNINRWSIGTKVAYRTTGGRFGYKDETGEISYENLLTLYEVTESVKYSIIKTSKFNISAGLNIGAGRVVDRHEYNIVLYNVNSENHVDRHQTLNVILGPELMCSYFLTKNLQVEVVGGYDKHIYTLKKTYYSDWYNVDWTGVRVGIGVGWTFNTK